jgi:uncharacterized protein YgiB involved in biofilm formation
MADSKSWAAPVVTTVLFGAAAAALLFGGGRENRPAPASSASYDDDEQWRNQYAAREACVADYSEEECREEARGGGVFYFGPWYRPGLNMAPGPGRARLANPNVAHNHTIQVQRGGFGRSARAYGGFRGG